MQQTDEKIMGGGGATGERGRDTARSTAAVVALHLTLHRKWLGGRKERDREMVGVGDTPTNSRREGKSKKKACAILHSSAASKCAEQGAGGESVLYTVMRSSTLYSLSAYLSGAITLMARRSFTRPFAKLSNFLTELYVCSTSMMPR